MWQGTQQPEWESGTGFLSAGHMTWTSDSVSLSTWSKETLNLKIAFYKVLGSQQVGLLARDTVAQGLVALVHINVPLSKMRK